MLERIMVYSVAAACIVGAGILGYAKYWESIQPVTSYKHVCVLTIDPYDIKSDMHWSNDGNRITISGEDKVIDFPMNRWDSTVQVNSIVDLVVRPSFPWPWQASELDGRSIDDHQS